MSKPSRLEDVDPNVEYDGLRVALIVPDPDLTGDTVDESNLAVLSRRDDATVWWYRHWTWRHYAVVLLPPGEAERVRDALADYPLLDDYDHSEREAAEAE